MPIKDRYHQTFIRALTKAGWKVTKEQVRLVISERRLWIDLQAVHSESNRHILIEVKGFENMPSPVEYLAAAVGQMVMYKAALAYLEIDIPLYMAVPIKAVQGILSETIGDLTLQKANIQLIAFDPEREEIVQWIT